MPDFVHLHCHTQFSLLDGAAHIPSMIKKAKDDGQKAVAITDHGNMFGVFKFVAEANKAGIKPIIGCEFYVVEDRFKKQFTRTDRDVRFHQLLLAKNEIGYKNISKLCSLGYIDGLYSKWPRVDIELIKQYKEGLIATTCCLGAQVPQAIIHKGEAEAEKIFLQWLDIFGDDFYIELQRHHIEDIDGTGMSQEDVNQVLIKWSKKHNVKLIATNDSHYIDKEDANAHDILLCINTGDSQAKEERFKFPNDEFFFKTKDQMSKLFADIPSAIETTQEIADKIDTPQLKRDVLLPNFGLPSEFKTEDDYLKHLAYEGAKRKYGELNETVIERLDLELKIIKDMGFAGYFLIVQDFIDAAKKMSVSVGPGRGSAAGSAVAYCIGITNIDPIKYQLLFERFLNPERVSMPDIDIDFDDEGRQKVIDYVVDKYGKNQVAQIITFGTMAARSSIRDVARVLDLPIPEADKLAKKVPTRPGVTLEQAFEEDNELLDVKKKKNLQGDTLRLAEKLEGSVRHSGIHAAGIIIAPDDLTTYIPVCVSKDSDLCVTQWDGKYIEDAGMLKMDFLGLKTLSIIRDACRNIEKRHGVNIDPEEIPLNDEATLELFQAGNTVGIFQFESAGMQKYLKELKPTSIEDLIAMNALYRPGPMEYIPEFVERKHGRKKVTYPHESLEEILEPTYGIMVYQEQIMKTAQIIAGFSLGAADILRRAMGKKKMSVMEEQKVLFVEGAAKNNIDEKKAAEIFDIMKEFAKYGFNRSHSAAYSLLAFQTAYLKANYPAEYMAAVLTHNMNDIKTINFFLGECKKLSVKALGPDINESVKNFTVNEKGEIRFALSAVKGVGEAAVESIIEEREENGPFVSIFDLMRRVNLRAVNKKSIESLTYAGAFDCFENTHRAQFFVKSNDEQTFLEKLVKFGATYQKQKDNSQHSLFGESIDVMIADPELPKCEEWTLIKKLKHEKEVTGIYLSGHPLDDYKVEIDSFTTCPVESIENHKNKELRLAGIISDSQTRISRKGNRFARFTMEDFNSSYDMAVFGEDFLKLRHIIEEEGSPVFVTGKYQKRKYGDTDDYEFRISNIELLNTIKEKRTKEILLTISSSGINKKSVNDITEVLNSHQGKIPLRFKVRDEILNYDVDFICRKCHTDLSSELFQELDGIKGLEYRLK
ncbi:MAG: DNA polymerase III subunit alpha [Chitinophagales bacterium]|nr:DNA polymerase III subunit alpha [Chitinophagales bacterium]